LAIIIIALVAMLPNFISTDAIKSRIVSEVQNVIGRKISFRGSPSVSFQPFLGIEISDVSIEDPYADTESPPFIQMDKLRGQLDILPALLGRVDIGNFQFVRPQFHLRKNGSGQANWEFEEGALRSVFNSIAGSKDANNSLNESLELEHIDLGRFEIIDGVVNYEDAISGTSAIITNLNGVLDWSTSDSALNLQMSGILQGEQISINADATDPLTLFSGGSSRISLEIVSAPLIAEFSGQADMIADIHLAGDFSMRSQSVNRLAEFFNVSILDNLVYGDLTASGVLDATPQKAQITEATVSLGGYKSKGLLLLSIDEADNPKLDGTLAFDTVDFSPFLEALSDYKTRTDAENQDTLVKSELALDVRFSANKVTAFGHEASDFAAAVSSRDGKWIFDVGSATMFGGTVIAKLDAHLGDTEPTYALVATATDIDQDSFTEALKSKILKPSGKLKLKVDLDSFGKTQMELFQNVSGTVRASAENGIINGLDLAQLQKLLSERKSRLSPSDINGQTAYKQFQLELNIFDGVAWTTQNKLTTDTHELVLFGNTDLYLGGLAMQAEIRNIKPDAESNANTVGVVQKVFIGGTLSSPLLTIQPSTDISISPRTE